MGLFSKRKRINVVDMPELMCNVILTNCWNMEIMNIVNNTLNNGPSNLKNGQFRGVTVLSAYGYAMMRLHLVSRSDIALIETLISQSREMFPDEFALRTLYEYNENDKQNVRKMLKQSYNNAYQVLIEGANLPINEMANYLSKQFIIDLFDGTSILDEELEIQINQNTSFINNVMGDLFHKLGNFSDNIKISKNKNSDPEYKSYRESMKEKQELFDKLFNK